MNQSDNNGDLPPQDTGGAGSVNITIDELVQATVRAMILHQEAAQIQPGQDMSLNNSTQRGGASEESAPSISNSELSTL